MLIELGISEPKEIDLDTIAWTRGAVVNYRPMDGCEATIVGSKRRAVISVNAPFQRECTDLIDDAGTLTDQSNRSRTRCSACKSS
jgi:hypothetical protein